MDDLRFNLCNICNERISAMPMAHEMYKRCYNEKKSHCKFSAENNIDPGEVLDELKGLSEIEQILIAQVFTVITVYRLRGSQNGYRGNIINFPQDIEGFTNKLSQNPSSLD